MTRLWSYAVLNNRPVLQSAIETYFLIFNIYKRRRLIWKQITHQYWHAHR